MTVKAVRRNLKSISEKYAPWILHNLLPKIADQIDTAPDFEIAHKNRKRTDAFICLVSQMIEQQDGTNMLFSIADPSIIYSFMQRYRVVMEYLSRMPDHMELPLSSETQAFIKQVMIDLYSLISESKANDQIMSNHRKKGDSLS